ncbi:MAG: bifunctional UDP-N-acetylglucosamine diphosphorylase/glucosamine-1-phosphate N-acetyltransferase GlmU [Phascolarctobacterium sp.]|nr:bifunctional UDP-N-acetylglucosamine diphosphorylase/glucosamine-1-phosphate N-acetyltransferase GlmU [Phascolarctobacterium sp.]
MSELVAVILAAGKGTRMRSKLPKVLHKVGGKAMLQHVIDAATAAGCDDKVVIIGHEAELVEKMVAGQGKTALQAEQLGTGHAVMQAKEALAGFSGTAMILCGDTPLLDGEELKKFYEAHKASGAAATVLTAIMDNPFGYGRIIRDAEGNVKGIVEQKDATEEQKAIKEINTGIYCLECPLMFDVLATLTCNNAQGEYYLTDVLEKLNNAGKKVGGVITEDSDMVMGINSRKQMSVAEAVMRERILDKLMDSGVTIMDPASTFIEASVKIGRDTIIYPYTWLEGNTVIGEDCEIGPNARFTDVEIGNNCNLHFIYGHECKVMDDVTAGPYVHLRPNTVIYNKVKIGNFVEVKNSNVGVGTKLPHLTYIGDSDIGSGVNMGCGCVTVNYDSKKKHRTVIGDNAFVGCNTNLVAPVTVEANTYIGAGSTITKDVPEDALGIARARQKNIEGWAKKYRES